MKQMQINVQNMLAKANNLMIKKLLFLLEANNNASAP